MDREEQLHFALRTLAIEYDGLPFKQEIATIIDYCAKDWPVGDECDLDGCVVNYSPDGTTRPYWCEHSETVDYIIGNTAYHYCTKFRCLVRICRLGGH